MVQYRIPIDRAVRVTLTREDQFPTTQGFNTAALLVRESIAGKLDATHRTYLYSNLYEVSLDWTAASEPYKSAQRFFQARIRPPQIKFAYRDPAASNITDQLDLIYQADPDWFWLNHTNELNDTPEQRAVADWAETKEILFGGDSNDTDTENPSGAEDVTFTAAISNASPAVITKTAHGLSNGDPIRFTTSGALPAPIVTTATYYVVGASANTFNIAAAVGGSAIATTSAGTGAHTAISPRYGGSIAEYVEAKEYDHTAIFYHTDPSSYLAAAAWGYAAGRDLDRSNFLLAQRGRIDSGQAYTLKFKTLPGVEPINKPSAAVQAITGFIPGLGVSPSAGHTANTYINIAGINMLVEGTVGSGAFIDEIHFIAWIKARMAESVLGTLATVARVPYTNQGTAYLIESGVQPPIRRAFAAGLIAPELEDDGTFAPEAEIYVDDVANVPVAQRRNRVAPDIKVDLRAAGAIHFSSVSMTLRY